MKNIFFNFKGEPHSHLRQGYGGQDFLFGAMERIIMGEIASPTLPGGCGIACEKRSRRMALKGKAALFFITAILAGVFLLPKISLAAIELVKSKSSPTVYFLDSQGIRHPFPNIETYASWYGSNFSKIATMAEDFISKYPLGGNITMRPGKNLVKFPSRPEVYAVEQGGVLRHIEEEDIAENIYGQNWSKKVVDIPEVFFGDYLIGESLRHAYELPNDIVYKIKNEKWYYWKTNGVLQPFDSFADVLANGYDADDVILGDRQIYSRRRLISGFNKNIFNPAAKPIINNEDCENKKLKTAFVFVYLGDYSLQQVEKLQKIKTGLEKSFNWATNGLSEIDASYPIIFMFGDNNLVISDEFGQRKLTNEIAFDFFDNNPDEFDFIFLFTNFNVMTGNEIANFSAVTNNVFGTNKPLLDASEIFGSFGKLKGIITMGNIDKYKIETSRDTNMTQNYLLHEILHNWSGEINFIDSGGNLSNDLLREPDLLHWSYYAGFISPLGGSGWQDNHDGTFTSLVSQLPDSNQKPYSELDLYLMGLLPAQVVSPVMYIVPDVAGAVGNTIKGEARYVTIDQIVAANGKWRCEY